MSTTQARSLCRPDSPTSRNLTHALRYAGQARRQYLQAAGQLENAGLYVAAHAFRFTAAQEKEHAAVFRGLLRVSGYSPDEADASLPPLPSSPDALLESVVQAETARCQDHFPRCAREAQAEGCPRIAAAFLRIADTEALHARRFAQYLSALRDGSLFHHPVPTSWLCLACGHLHFGPDAPACCDTCRRACGSFIRSDFHPFTVTS